MNSVRRRIIFEITGRRLVVQPLSRVALSDVSRVRQFARRHGAALMKRLVEPQLISNSNERDAKRAAEIVENSTHELVKFAFVHHRCLLRQSRLTRASTDGVQNGNELC